MRSPVQVCRGCGPAGPGLLEHRPDEHELAVGSVYGVQVNYGTDSGK